MSIRSGMRAAAESIRNYLKVKKQRVRFIIFLFVFVLAVFAITYAVVQSGRKDAGYYAVDVTAESKIETYDSGLTLMYYADGDSNAVKRTLNAVSAEYSKWLLLYDRLLDAKTEYEGLVNIATLNAHPGQTYALSEDLFAILSDALDKTDRGEAYSLFDGALYNEWLNIVYLENAAEFDPTVDETVAARMKALAAQGNIRANFDLKVIDEKQRTVCFTLSDAYKAFLTQYELDAPVLDLNLLRDAYLMQSVAEKLTESGFSQGYLYTESGLSYVLDRSDMNHALYVCKNNAVASAAEISATPNSVCCRMTAFPVTEKAYGYYSVQSGGRAVYRHRWLDLRSGVCRDTWMSANAVFEQTSPVDVVYRMLPLTAAESEQALQSALAAMPSASAAAYSLQTAPEALHTHVSSQGIDVRLTLGVQGEAF